MINMMGIVSENSYLAALAVVGPGVLLMMLGAQTIMAGMFLGVLSVVLKRG
jgi:hypothetical protein